MGNRVLLLGSSFITIALGAASACHSSSSTVAAPTDAGPPEPVRVCKTPTGAHPYPWFEDATADFGLAPSATMTPIALGVIAGDFDGDGYPDLITTSGNSERGPATTGNLAGKQARFVFMNRPDPNDATKRTYVDATQSSGLLATRDGAGNRGWGLTNVGDLNNDGKVDVILCPSDELQTAGPNPQDACDAFLNDGTGHFTLAPSSDLNAKVIWATSGALLDFDRDGILDFWPGTVAHWPYDPDGPNDEPPTIYRGNGDGTFTNVSAAVGLPQTDGSPINGTEWRHTFGVAVCDIDGDGLDDVVTASYGREENQVWHFDGTKFTNVAHAWGVDYDDRMDYTDDQSYRCYCANVGACTPAPPAPGMDCCIFCEQEKLTCGGASSQCPASLRGWEPAVSTKPFSLGGNYFSIACGDIDDDGDLDLVSATIVHGDVGSSADPTEIIVNPGGGGKFTRPGNQTTGLDRPATGFFWNHGDDMIALEDVDLDGRKDIFSTTTGVYEVTDTHRLWHQKSDGTFEEIETQAGLLPASSQPNLQGPAFIDIDGDGDLDLVVGESGAQGGPAGNETLHVFRNLAGQDNNWTRIRLVGSGSGGAGTSAIGAIVRVTAGGRTQTEYVRGGYGHGNVEADLALTFGLGATCDIDSISVQWPDAAASVTTYTNVRANYGVTLKQGSTVPTYEAAIATTQ